MKRNIVPLNVIRKKKKKKGSLFFCNKFREKCKDERRELHKETHCCMFCLAKSEKGHKRDIGACKSCGSMHNILLCSREKDEDHKVMSATDTSNQNDHDDLTEDENAYEDNAQVNVYMVSKGKSGKTSTSKKVTKK